MNVHRWIFNSISSIPFVVEAAPGELIDCRIATARFFPNGFFIRATTRQHPPFTPIPSGSVAAVNKKTTPSPARRRKNGQLKNQKLMRNPTPYLKMRVLGAIDMAEGNSIQARIQAVSQMTFTDEDGHPRQFTWRTIQTWFSRYQKHGVTVMENQPRSDKGKIRKVTLEDVLEALRKVQPKVHGKTPTLALLYRLCIRSRTAHPGANRAQHVPAGRQTIRTAQARRGLRQQSAPGFCQGARQ